MGLAWDLPAGGENPFSCQRSPSLAPAQLSPCTHLDGGWGSGSLCFSRGWDPAEPERVGPTGQDLESERGRGGRLLAQARGDLPSRLSQSCSPTVIVGWGLPPRPQLPDTVVRTKSSGQPASPRLCSSALTHVPFDHQGLHPLRLSEQRVLSGNYVSHGTRSSLLGVRPHPA